MTKRVRELLGALEDPRARPHLDPVRAGLSHPAQGGLSALQKEIAEEIAGSLGRAARRVEAALARLGDLEESILEARRGGEVEQITELVTLFNAERELALRCLRDLKIQREALGFARHDDLARVYPVPDPKKVSGPA